MHLSIGVTVAGAVLLMSGVFTAITGEALRLTSPGSAGPLVETGIALAVCGLGCGAVLLVLVASGWAARRRPARNRTARSVRQVRPVREARPARTARTARTARRADSAEEWLSQFRPAPPGPAAPDSAPGNAPGRPLPDYARRPGRLPPGAVIGPGRLPPGAALGPGRLPPGPAPGPERLPPGHALEPATGAPGLEDTTDEMAAVTGEEAGSGIAVAGMTAAGLPRRPRPSARQGPSGEHLGRGG